MIYKFRSKASGDVVMLEATGDRLLRIIGREPAAKGVIEPAAMPAAIAALKAAAAAEPAADAERADADGEPAHAEAVLLRQRVWPMVELLQRSAAAGEPVVWGV